MLPQYKINEIVSYLYSTQEITYDTVKLLQYCISLGVDVDIDSLGMGGINKQVSFISMIINSLSRIEQQEIIIKFKSALVFIEKPTKKLQQLHNMLWEI
jgi:hypothetical protein